ncbi:hypothetical protein NKH18_21545 [Streptomyces sp. M10(2022)]
MGAGLPGSGAGVLTLAQSSPTTVLSRKWTEPAAVGPSGSATARGEFSNAPAENISEASRTTRSEP